MLFDQTPPEPDPNGTRASLTDQFGAMPLDVQWRVMLLLDRVAAVSDEDLPVAQQLLWRHSVAAADLPGGDVFRPLLAALEGVLRTADDVRAGKKGTASILEEIQAQAGESDE